uniref:Uncharacterized protein n=1 Tax=Arundo donax TaxID=35708 RepID=A0A0A9EHY9_ARUDO
MHISSISREQQAVLCAFQHCWSSHLMPSLSSHGSHIMDPLLWKIHTHGSLA